MSRLPPYSTFRTDPKQQIMYPHAISHGNILTFTPPGFKQSLNVKFPDSRLAVCDKCKKNYKTRDMCRVRNGHTSSPWTTAFICMTLDETCTDENGKYVDKPLTVRMINWQPYTIIKPFDNKTPVCAACKKTNRTRSFCRDRHKHKHLPWCTVYVILSALDSTDPSTVVAAPSEPVAEDEENKQFNEDAKPKASERPPELELSPKKRKRNDDASKVEDGKDQEAEEEKTEEKEGEWEGDDINDIPESRTFLAKVSCKGKSIHWLDMSDFDGADATSGMHGMQIRFPVTEPNPQVDSTAYFQNAMGYAAHQNALKSQQQYFFHMQRQHQQHYAAQQAVWQAQYNQAPLSASQAPVTAGEAAAQQQKQNQQQLLQDGQWQQPIMYPPNLYQQQMMHFQQSGGILPQGMSQGVDGQTPYASNSPEDLAGKLDMEPAPVNGLSEQSQEESETKRARYV